MEMMNVESSNIKAIGWEEETLVVEFVKGGRYMYHNVPELLWNAFKSSDSKGRFFHAKIRPNQHKFEYEKLKEE